MKDQKENEKLAKDLTVDQLAIVKEMLGVTLKGAAKSMERMLKVRMKSELFRFGDGIFRPISDFDSLGQFRVHVVKVALKGQIRGAFYFLINGHEVELINNVAMPKDINPTNANN